MPRSCDQFRNLLSERQRAWYWQRDWIRVGTTGPCQILASPGLRYDRHSFSFVCFLSCSRICTTTLVSSHDYLLNWEHALLPLLPNE